MDTNENYHLCLFVSIRGSITCLYGEHGFAERLDCVFGDIAERRILPGPATPIQPPFGGEVAGCIAERHVPQEGSF